MTNVFDNMAKYKYLRLHTLYDLMQENIDVFIYGCVRGFG